MHRIALFAFATLLAATAALGEDFWVKKEYMRWTDDEVRKLMSNSPWAKDVTVSAPPSVLGGQRETSSSGFDLENPGTAGRGRGRGGRGGGDSNGDGGGEVLLTLTMSWRSALPLRKATVKSRIGSATEIPSEALQLLSSDPPEYLIVVSGMPARMARLIQDGVRLGQSTLKVAKKAPIAPKSVDFQTRTQTVDVIFAFPRTPPIVLEDKEVELNLKLGQIEAKQKFILKDMVYNGKLEL